MGGKNRVEPFWAPILQRSGVRNPPSRFSFVRGEKGKGAEGVAEKSDDTAKTEVHGDPGRWSKTRPASERERGGDI